MERTLKSLVFIIALAIGIGAAAQAPFRKGFNFAGWFQQSSAEQIQFTRFTKQDFIHVKNMGCDNIRLPIHLFNMAGDPPDYRIDPLLFDLLDQVVDWAEELQLNLILDNHSFDPDINTTSDILDELSSVWKQMAEHYKDRSNLIYYEILNEPHGIADATWNSMQQTVIDSIRTIDKKHTIVVGPANWNGYDDLKYMPKYDDDNLIYTFHFYSPFLFTHQGASWVNPAMDIAGVPFPYNPARMPSLPEKLKGTWVEEIYRNYPNEGTETWVKSQIDIAVDFMKGRNVPLWCGEFGAYIPNSTTDDRARWFSTVRSYFEKNNISWTMWEFAGGFGIYEPGTNGLFDYDVNIPIIEALGLTPPEQKEFILSPDTTGFTIYDDYIAHNVRDESWLSNGILSFYSQDQPAAGQYCIHWTGADQYNDIGFLFAPIKDMSQLVSEDYAVDFWVRCTQPSAKIDIRFLDTKTDDPDDHPWRMRYILDDSIASWNGNWHHLQIPLNEFTEQGAWDNNQWYEPEGKFDWTKVERFEIVAEHHDLKGIDFYFDNIRVVNPKLQGVRREKFAPSQFCLLQNYPNPFNPVTTIRFYLVKSGDAVLKIFNTRGQKMYEIKEKGLTPGLHSLRWNGSDFEGNQMPSGVYIYKLVSGRESQVKRMVLLK